MEYLAIAAAAEALLHEIDLVVATPEASVESPFEQQIEDPTVGGSWREAEPLEVLAGQGRPDRSQMGEIALHAPPHPPSPGGPDNETHVPGNTIQQMTEPAGRKISLIQFLVESRKLLELEHQCLEGRAFYPEVLPDPVANLCMHGQEKDQESGSPQVWLWSDPTMGVSLPGLANASHARSRVRSERKSRIERTEDAQVFEDPEDRLGPGLAEHQLDLAKETIRRQSLEDLLKPLNPLIAGWRTAMAFMLKSRRDRSSPIVPGETCGRAAGWA